MKTQIQNPLNTGRAALPRRRTNGRSSLPALIAAALLLSTINYQLSTAHAQGTAFTYQGRLNSGGSPAGGTYNLTFSLFNTNTSGVSIAGPVTNNAVSVTNGLFTVLVDFGPAVFTGATNWLEIAVETNGATPFTTLVPRQQITPTPYAILAGTASGLSGTLLASQLTSIGNTNGAVYGNFFVGSAGNSAMAGSYNTAYGYEALSTNMFGSANTADGFYALLSNTSGSDNTANGVNALALNTSGSDNIALGYQAGYNISTGSSNIDIGNQGFSTDTNIIRIGSGQSQTFIAGVINGNGAGLTNLSGVQIPAGVLTNNQTGVTLSGTFSGNGGGLTNLSAANLTGSVANGQLANSSLSVNAGAGLTGGGSVALGGATTLAIANGAVTPAMLASPSLIINAGSGLSGGGTIALGGSTTLANAGVLSLTGGGGVTVSAASGNVTLNTVAGGDVTGSLAGATVVKINGTPLGNLGVASSGQMLAWNGASWVPTTPPNVAAESTRAQAAEGTLTGNLSAETTRAVAAESTLTGNLNAETTRAVAAEGTLTGNLSAETTRAEAAEVTLQSNLNGAALRGGGNTFTGANTFTQPLTVSNDLAATGLARFGTGTGTAEAPVPAGLVVRRINSTVTTSNSVIARSDVLTLIRDGSYGGLMISYPASPGTQTIAAMGITSAGAQVNFYTTLANPGTAGTVQIYSNAQAVHSCQITFGNTYLEGHVTQVNISRALNDNFWVGTVNSTFNQ